METNQPKPGNVDPELERARKSMGGRIDPDETSTQQPKEEEKKEEPVQVPSTDQKPKDEPAPKTEEPKKEEPVVVDPPKTDPPAQDKDKVQRPEKYIPLPKYLDEKKDWEREKQRLEDNIKELTNIANQGESDKKDEAKKAIAEAVGVDVAVVDQILDLAKANTLSPEALQKIERAGAIAEEAQIQAEFTVEYDNVAKPTLLKLFPDAKPEQLQKARDFLDVVSHTKEFHDKPMTKVIEDNQSELSKLFVVEQPKVEKEPDPTPTGGKTMEHGRQGAGSVISLSPSDFESKNGESVDFAPLLELNKTDPEAANKIVKGLSNKAYTKFVYYLGNQENNGIQVTRDGKKVNLK